MRSNKRAGESISTMSWRHDMVRCNHNAGRLFKKTSRTVIDESGSLAITAWTCATCGDLVEEIRLLSRDGGGRLHPIRYTVASCSMTKHVAAPALS